VKKTEQKAWIDVRVWDIEKCIINIKRFYQKENVVRELCRIRIAVYNVSGHNKRLDSPLREQKKDREARNNQG